MSGKGLNKTIFSKEILFTPLDMLSFTGEQSYQFLVNKMKCKIIKIPSGEINGFLMLNNVDLNRHKLFISTGMASMLEIANCLNFIAKTKVYKINKDKG